jgi:hypothetical protein
MPLRARLSARAARRVPGPLLPVLLGVAGLWLTACSEPVDVPVDTSPQSSVAASSAEPGTSTAAAQSTAPAATDTPSAPATSATAAPAADAPVLVLEVDGLGVATGASIRHLPFGTDKTTIRTLLTNTVGAPKATDQPECGQGPRTQLDRQGFSALFDGTKFVGWTDSGKGSSKLTTADGIGVGSTLAAVRSSQADITVTTGSLGPEFTSPGGLGGILDGTGANAKVTVLYAGESCFFR